VVASPGLRQAFVAFREQSIWLRTCFNTFDALFQQEHQPKDLLQRTAPLFFDELNHVLLDYCRLQACKLTDPADTWSHEAQARVESLTVCNLNRDLEREGLKTQAIDDASAALMRYRKLVKPSRHKAIAHIDKAATLANQPIGAHAEQEVVDFLDSLQSYNDEVGEVVGEGPLDFRGTSGQGDVLTLLQFLRAGLASKDTE
jgi:hypothetical protein